MRADIDTDVIIPMHRLIGRKRGEFGPYAFEPWRYSKDGSENRAFVLNDPRYRGAQVLIADENFGCGSSREHAVWALMDCGFRCVIAPSFGDIFYANCFQNGMLPIRLPRAQVQRVVAEIEERPQAAITIDLQAKAITTPEGDTLSFDIEPDRREGLLAGLDEIAMTLRLDPQIRAFQAMDRSARPWIYRRESNEGPPRLLLLAGDGIGPEVMAEVKRIAMWFAERRGLQFQVGEELFGISAWKVHGTLMREETWAQILAADAILLGAFGSLEYEGMPPDARKADPLLRIRKELDLFINLRPVKTLKALVDASTLKPEVIEGCDMVIVRELAGGIYFGSPRGIEALPGGGERAFNTCTYSTVEVERIARAAFDLARVRRGRVCSVDKANVLIETGGLWRRTVQRLRDREFPDVELSHMYVDNCAMQLVRAPRQFDVLLTENLFGDILSDCAAMVAGSLGMLPSASMSAIGENGKRRALYEPIHGSAPDIAGRGIANPIGAILSFALCLRYSLGLAQEAKLLEGAVETAIEAGCRTADIAQRGDRALGTHEMGDAILERLDVACFRDGGPISTSPLPPA
jgi:3-isopropylmalate dehydrogenase